ncbi:unnamed protein product [Caenorhabditis angaria]|uniref:Neuroguidin n=1 Tax=Caenorhabditis angaria TaxID=860376 RepID=A0A9P1I7P3_9PELO|nr:unnamed protein product [Caenorhabditis angaria]
MEDRFSDLAASCAESSDEAVSAMQKLLANLKATKGDKEGLSLLKVKNAEMVAYLSEISILMSKMLKGDQIQTDSCTKRALKHRVILEKIRPIEDKMRPQIEKLLSKKSGEKSVQKAANLRVRLENMDVGDDENEEEDEDENGDEKSKEAKKYVAPKIRAVRYEDEEEAPSKQVEKAKRRAMQSSLILELKNQYSDAPEEIREVSERKFQYDREREQYEEDNFTRVRMTKEQKRKSEKLGKAETLDDLLNFGDYMMRSEDGKSALNLKRKRLSSTASGAPKKKKTQKERKKAAKGKKEGRKRAIRRRQ